MTTGQHRPRPLSRPARHDIPRCRLGAQRGLPCRCALLPPYLQSGNVIAHSSLQPHQQVSDLVRAVIGAEFGLDVPVIVRRPAEIDDVIAANPFPAQAIQRAHLVRVIFLAAVPSADRTSRLMSDSSLRETCRVADTQAQAVHRLDRHDLGHRYQVPSPALVVAPPVAAP